jgi:hypothetical protein
MEAQGPQDPQGQPPPPGQPQQPPPPPQQPAQQPQQLAQQQPPAGGRLLLADDSNKVWLLSIVTCGIYGIIWYHRLQQELGQWSGGRIETNPTNSVLAVTLGACLIVPPIMSWIGTVDRIRTAQLMTGLQPTVTFWGTVGRAFLLSYHYKWLQDNLNEVAQRPAQ